VIQIAIQNGIEISKMSSYFQATRNQFKKKSKHENEFISIGNKNYEFDILWGGCD